MDLIYAVCIGDSEKKGEENSEKKNAVKGER